MRPCSVGHRGSSVHFVTRFAGVSISCSGVPTAYLMARISARLAVPRMDRRHPTSGDRAFTFGCYFLWVD